MPAGTYPLGSAEGEADERPAQPAWTLPQGFRIAWAPVTNAEYQCFIDAGGYDDEAWWAPQGAAALAWFKGELVDEASITYWRERVTALRDDFDTALQRYFPNATEAAVEADLRRYAGWTAQETEDNLNAQFGAQRFSQPREWDAPAFYHSRQPVVGVCAWEAQAYCLWLSAASGQAVRLPTEAEWEAAARGPRGLAWPWGPDAPDAHRLNAYDSHLRRSSPVGVFPLADQAGADGAAPLADLAGNVWEWCASAYSHTLEPQVMHRPVGTDEAPDQPRAVRGGAWLSLPRHCRAGYRYWFHPPDRSGSLGFRVVICPI